VGVQYQFHSCPWQEVLRWGNKDLGTTEDGHPHVGIGVALHSNEDAGCYL
jgi:hypothetical protein